MPFAPFGSDLRVAAHAKDEVGDFFLRFGDAVLHWSSRNKVNARPISDDLDLRLLVLAVVVFLVVDGIAESEIHAFGVVAADLNDELVHPPWRPSAPRCRSVVMSV